MSLTYRDLTTLDEYAAVVELERVIWGPGYTDVVPTPILTVSVHRESEMSSTRSAGPDGTSPAISKAPQTFRNCCALFSRWMMEAESLSSAG